MKGAEQLIRPDAIVSLIKQLRWGGHAGVGEVKISEPTSNNYNLALDLVRISMLSKTLVNSEDLKAVLGFQVNGTESKHLGKWHIIYISTANRFPYHVLPYGAATQGYLHRG